MQRIEVESNNLSIARIEEKCIKCGMCLKTCESINNIQTECVNCGQCILTCPTGALIPKYDYKKVLNYLNDTDYTVVVLTSPAVRVAIGDEFGFPPGEFLEGKMVSSLKELGFDYVFDTTFGADLTVMEEANELVERIKNNNLPMYTSCCPSWVLFMEKFHSSDLNNLSSCKSPIAMQGAMIKSYFADLNLINRDKIITVALTPCVSKKTEIAIYKDVDYVITTRELAMMLRECNINFNNLADKEYDCLLGKGSGAGLIFGASGGVMEATLRTAYYMLNKETAPENFYHFEKLRGEKDIKEAVVDMKALNLKIAVVNTISNVQKYYDTLKKYDFIEVMACPGGCIGGGGQPLVATAKMAEYREKRINSLYHDDSKNSIKNSYTNPEIKDAYDSYINKNEVKLHTTHKNFTTDEKESIITNR